MVYGLYVLSPVNQPLPPLSARCVSIVANVAPAPGAPGPHDFAVRSTASPGHPAAQTRNHQIPSETASNVASPCDAAAALAFRFTFRDVGDTPLRPKRNGSDHTPDSDFRKDEYFLRWGLTSYCGRCPAGKSVGEAQVTPQFGDIAPGGSPRPDPALEISVRCAGNDGQKKPAIRGGSSQGRDVVEAMVYGLEYVRRGVTAG
jgi:hypothetical protein